MLLAMSLVIEWSGNYFMTVVTWDLATSVPFTSIVSTNRSMDR